MIDLLRKSLMIPLAALLLVLPALGANAQHSVNSDTPVVVSDDIYNRTTEVQSAGDSGSGGDESDGKSDATKSKSKKSKSKKAKPKKSKSKKSKSKSKKSK